MKKAFCALAVSCLGIGMTVAAFSGCASEEELFAKATAISIITPLKYILRIPTAAMITTSF